MRRRRRLRRWVIVTLFGLVSLGIAGVAGGAYWLWFITPPKPVIVASATPTPPQFTMLIVQEDGDARRVLTCDSGKCTSQDLPSSVDDSAVFDGTSLYYYVLEGAKKNQRKILKRKDIDKNEEKTVIEETPLVRPRDLVISPDGKKIVFWLDNIDDPKKKLTELWMYDATESSTRLLVEKVTQDTVMTEPRWNRLGNYVWFVMRQGEEQKPQLYIVNTQPIEVESRFSTLDWQSLAANTDQGLMDISLNGTALAYVEGEGSLRHLTIVYEGHPEMNSTVTGAVQYVQWLPNGNLIYVMRERKGFTLWQLSGTVHQFITRQSGVFETARIDEDTGDYLAFITSGNGYGPDISFLNLETSKIVNKHALSPFGTGIHLVSFSSTNIEDTSTVSSTLDDETIAAFIQKQIQAIAGTAENLELTRIITTRQVNTVYVDYRDTTGEDHRLLVTVRDAIHPEWAVKGTYVKRKGEWQKIEGTMATDPAPYRLYEWEESLQRWILKSDTG